MSSTPAKPTTGRWVAIPEGGRAFVPDPLPRGLPVPPSITRLLANTRALLGRLLEGIRLLPSPDLFLQPFQTREAVLSSRIEGTRTTLEEAFVQAATSSEDELVDDDREVHNYGKALRLGIDALDQGRPLSVYLLKDLHHELLHSAPGENRRPGEFRLLQVWIGTRESERDIRLARFVPPPPLELDGCLADLAAYLGERGPDEALVRIALAHYQLECIHPFQDGNGRIGRLLLSLQMVWEGVLDRPCVYVSPVLERRRSEYYDGLLQVSTKGSYLPWIEFFAGAVAESAEETLDRIHELRALQEEFTQRLRKVLSPKPLQLLPTLFSQPYVTVTLARRALGVTQSPTAQKAIDRLVEVGILERTDWQSKGRRGRPARLYRCPAVLEILRE